jgi:hypothetical protein
VTTVIDVRQARADFIRNTKRAPVEIHIHPQVFYEVLESCAKMEFRPGLEPQEADTLCGMTVIQDAKTNHFFFKPSEEVEA